MGQLVRIFKYLEPRGIDAAKGPRVTAVDIPFTGKLPNQNAGDLVRVASSQSAINLRIVLSGVTLHLLDNVNQKISATEIRNAVRAKRPIKRFVPESVEEYIKKEGLYV